MNDLPNLEKQKNNLDIKITEEENNINEQKQEFDNMIRDMLKKDLDKLLPWFVAFDVIFLVIDPLVLITLIIVEVLGVKLGMKVARENFPYPKTAHDELLENLIKERNKINELIAQNKERKNLQENSLNTLYTRELGTPQERKNEYNNQKLVLKRKGK